MANNNLPALKNALNTESVKNKFNEMLGKKSAGFMTSITSVVQNAFLYTTKNNHKEYLLPRANLLGLLLTA